MDIYKGHESDFFFKFLSIFVFIGLLGAVKPVLFNEGSDLAKYFAKEKQLEMVQEKSIEEYMESALFGDGHVTLESIDGVSSEVEGNESVNFIFRYDFIIATVLLLASFLLLWPQALLKLPLYHLLIPISLWLFCQSIGVSLNGGKRFSELAVFAHATRWGLPLILWLGVFLKKGNLEIFKSNLIFGMLIVFSGLTFATHGWEAIQLKPSFQDLIYNFAGIFSLEVSEWVNTSLLRTVGCMDILLSLALLIFRKPKLLIWMSCWGFLTAISRPLTMGFDAWSEAAMRVANFALPMTIYFVIKFNSEKKALTEPELKTQKLEMMYE